MGVCETKNKSINHLSSKVPRLEHFQTTGNPESHAYKFSCTGKNNLVNKKLNLKFIFYNFKVKYCTSHKPKRDSLYIIEIKIGEKIFPLLINQGNTPNIPNEEDIKNGFFEEKEYTLNELENTYLLINIYEFLEDISPSLKNTTMGLPDTYKQKCDYSSFFRISLLSFLFKPTKCDFPMIGTKQLSQKTRISFYTFIEHKEKIRITASSLKNPNISKLIFQTKEHNLSTTTRQQNNNFSLMTPPLTMVELQRADIFLETTENSDVYNYISLNGLKEELIKQIGNQIINQENNFNEINLHNPIDMSINNNNNININNKGLYGLGNNRHNTNINYNNQIQNDEAFLYLDNLPIITQISDILYFTEYGIIYNTSILNLVNQDQELHQYRKGKQISSEDFYNKLNGYYEKICPLDYDFSILNEMLILLMRSIDTDKFMFIYPSMDDLNKMVCLFLKVGIKVIEKIKMTNEEYKLILLTKLINILMKREELDNGVLYECINKSKGSNNQIEILYNNLTIELLNLYQLLLTNKLSSSNDTSLIELFSRLYFQKYNFRIAILNSIYGHVYDSTNGYNLNPNDVFLYDIINDEKVENYLLANSKKAIKKFLKQENYYNTIKYDNYKLLKRIILFMNEKNINLYPHDFTLYNDNLKLLDIMERDINKLKKEKFDKSLLTNDFYESLMLLSNSYSSISRINNDLIMATNGHNPFAVYTLFIYFKSLFDYYYSMTNYKIIMDYSVFELACEKLADKEDSISLPRLFWLYYCCSDMILSGNLKWFIVNIINKNFDKFAFHWSFTIRLVFFKLAIFILNTKLKKDEGKLFKNEKLNPYINNTLYNMEDPYKQGSYKDFKTIEKEYKEWLAKNNYNEYPAFFLPAPIATNGVID